jgi:hypothetical protein
MRTKKSHVNIIKPFQSLDEIVRATGRSWRTVRKRLAEAQCYPLPLDMDRGDTLALFDDGPLPTYTAAEQQKISARIDALLAKERAGQK